MSVVQRRTRIAFLIITTAAILTCAFAVWLLEVTRHAA